MLCGVNTNTMLIAQFVIAHRPWLGSCKALHDSFTLCGFAVSQESLQGVHEACKADCFDSPPQPMKPAMARGNVLRCKSFSSTHGEQVVPALKRQLSCA